MGKISNFLDFIYFCSNPIHLAKYPIHLKSILLDPNFNLIYFLHILWI